MFTTSFDALVLAAMTSFVLYELVDITAPRLIEALRRR